MRKGREREVKGKGVKDYNRKEIENGWVKVG